MQQFKIVFGILSLFFLLFIAASTKAQSSEKPPQAVNGVLDLRQWDLETDGPVRLYGEWLFYWNQFVPPASISGHEPLPEPSGTFSLPSYWNNYEIDGKPISGVGYGSYLLTVKLSKPLANLAFKINDIQTAYRFHVDGREIAAIGQTGRSAESSEPAYKPLIADFSPDRSQFQIVIHVSNFHHRKGGAWESITLGTSHQIREYRENKLTLELFLIGSILIMGLYHIGLFMHRRQDRAALFFGLFCIDIVVRSLITGERFINQLLPGASWEVLYKVEFLSFYLGVPLFVMFLHSLFPMDVSRWMLRATQMLGALFSLVVIATPSIVFTNTLTLYQIITSIVGLYVTFILIRAIARKREGAYVLLLGFLVLFGSVINDILHVNQFIHTGFYLSFGLFVFIFSQAFLIAVRFSQAFNTVEQQTWELIKTNQAFREEIKERKKLEQNLLESHDMFEKSRIGIILGLAKLAEYRDEDTGNHLERMREYCRILAQELSRIERYKDYITKAYINDLYQSSILHDIGKVGVPDAILLKPDKLTPEEFTIIKKHSKIGGDAILNVESRINIRSFLTLGKEIAYSHHEKWDGSGYPRGLKGNEIPLSARIVALADVYDALTSERPYKKPFSHEKARTIILESSGSHFDPAIVDAFLAREDQFETIRAQFQDQ